jgi:hypothetical protein
MRYDLIKPVNVVPDGSLTTNPYYQVPTILSLTSAIENIWKVEDGVNPGKAVSGMAADEDTRQAQIPWGLQVHRGIVDQQAGFRPFTDSDQCFLKGFGLGLAVGLHGIDIDDVVKMILDIQGFQNTLGMRGMGVGEDDLALGKTGQDRG